MRAALLAALALLAAWPARAQAPAPVPDPSAQSAIKSGLFGEDEPQPGDEDVAAGRVEPPPAPAPAPSAPGPGAPPPAVTGDYDARVRSSFAAAESFQGPLDGGWTLAWRDRLFYRLRFADHAGTLEGVWSDARPAAGLSQSGALEVEERSPTRLRLRFVAARGVPVTLDLRPARGGGWTGRLRRADKLFDGVRMVKTSP